jgi:dienelactone hydrolase
MEEDRHGVRGKEAHRMSRREFVKGAFAVTAGAAVFRAGAENEAHGAERGVPTTNKERGRISVERLNIKGEGVKVPAVVLSPPQSSCAAVIVHGYGGCKEEQFGLAWRIAETGITACAIDLRGHGEHELPLDEKVMSDVSVALRHSRSHGKVVAIGHSLGGRLALLSDADFVIGISPALNSVLGPQTMKILKDLRSYRVREDKSGDIFDIFKKLPTYTPSGSNSTLLMYGERDVPEVKETCVALASRGEHVAKIDQALHADIFLLEPTFRAIRWQLDDWSGKM